MAQLTHGARQVLDQLHADVAAANAEVTDALPRIKTNPEYVGDRLRDIERILIILSRRLEEDLRPLLVRRERAVGDVQTQLDALRADVEALKKAGQPPVQLVRRKDTP